MTMEKAERLKELRERLRETDSAIESCRKTLAELEEEKHALSGEIEAIEASCRCDRCGAELPDDALFCPSCGKRILVARAEVTENTCPQCGAKLEDDARFCVRCGFALHGSAGEEQQPEEIAEEPKGAAEGDVPSYDEPVYEEPAATGPSWEEQMAETQTPPAESERAAFCPNCGNPLEDDAVFCNMCGMKVVG